VATFKRNQFTAAIDDIYYAGLNDPTKELNVVLLRELVKHVRTTYATISQPEINDNMAEFHTAINAALPLAVYMRKQEKCQTFTLDARVPISEATMVTTGTKVALNCGGMELVWREWKCRPVVDQTWNNWKQHWTAAFTKSRNIHCMMTPEGAFANQVATNAEQAAMMARSLDNLANVAIQKNDTVEKLVVVNKRLAKALADANAAIVCLRLPGHSASQLGGSSNACPPHLAATPPEWDPQGYYWTHGWKVKLGHSSTTCTYRKDNHDTTASRTNTKDGSTLNKASTPA
jgi:hypothetical protein